MGGSATTDDHRPAGASDPCAFPRVKFPPPTAALTGELMRISPVFNDLARSFPALMLAIVDENGPIPARRAALQAVLEGHSLKVAAGHLAMPMWLRALPAEALHRPVPPLYDGPELPAVAAYAMPRIPSEILDWLEAISFAMRLSGPEFGTWLARSTGFLPPRCDGSSADWILAWGFYSQRPETAAGAAIRKRWHPDIGTRTAADEMVQWRRRISSMIRLGAQGQPWFRAGSARGFTFEPLDTAEKLFAESARMQNCLDIYPAQLGHARFRLYSVRIGERSVATLELGLRSDEPDIPMIVQLKGLRNARAGKRIWQAAHAWMGSQPFAIPPHRTTPEQSTAQLWVTLWAPLIERCEEIGAGQQRFEWTRRDWLKTPSGLAFRNVGLR